MSTQFSPEDTDNEAEIEKQFAGRPRSATLLNLKWLAERLRKARRVKRGLEEGTYSLDSDKIARALLNENEE